jgi:hypothetical protein
VAGPPREIAWNLSTIGVTLTLLGDCADAEAPLRESVALGRQAGDNSAVVASLRALGELYRSRGDFARARLTALEGLVIARGMGSKLWSLSLLVTLGNVAAAEREWALAADWYRQGLELVSPGGLAGTMAYSLRRYAASCVALKDNALAAKI